MTEHPSTVTSLICSILVSSTKVLELLLKHDFHTPLNEGELQEAVYLEYLSWGNRLPDHVFQQSWQWLKNHSPTAEKTWALKAVHHLADEFLEFQHGALTVKRKSFGVWQQSVLSRMTGLPVQAAAQMWLGRKTYRPERRHSLLHPTEKNWACDHLPVITPFDSLVEDYIQQQGLHETHLHLNGSTHAEQCWLRALKEPEREIQDFAKKWHSIPKVRELARAINPRMTPALLRHQLLAARRLRDYLIVEATENESDHGERWPQRCTNQIFCCVQNTPYPQRTHDSAKDEIDWQHQLFEHLDKQPSVRLGNMLHLYWLLQHQHYRLLVQNEEQFGFDQFQKLTFTDLREPAEKNYRDRFLAMHGKGVHSRILYLEGRFAPKATTEKNHHLLLAVLKGYWEYLHDGEESPPRPPYQMSQLLEKLEQRIQQAPSQHRRHRLALVAHFIKQPWSHTGKKAGPYRFYQLRQKLEKDAFALQTVLSKWPRLHDWVRGIDAASNELDTPPEVFASVYRLCHRMGLTHRSYHVGEDFRHLLGGLRHMLDALELLDLRDGDRMGHGTAMGIAPQLWLDRMPSQLLVPRSEWMLDLLGTWRLLREIPGMTTEAYQVECELTEHLHEVFQEEISCVAFERAMRFRHLHMGYVKEVFENKNLSGLSPFNDHLQQEAEQVLTEWKKHQSAVCLLYKWQSCRDLWKRSETSLLVEAAYFNASVYVRLQQALMKKVAERNVLIETLPSSNIRISQYHQFKEHHSLRWMRVPGFVQDGDPEIMVTLGSDDPGIFASDLNSEFYQLYATLRNLDMSDHTALNHLKPVNERGRQYHFHGGLWG